MSLGDEGLGLDSVDIVEFLLACEAAIGGRPTDELLDRGAIAVGAVIDHFAVA